MRKGRVNSGCWAYMQVARWHTQFFRLLERSDVFGCPLNLFWRFPTRFSLFRSIQDRRVQSNLRLPAGLSPPARNASALATPTSISAQPLEQIVSNNKWKEKIYIPIVFLFSISKNKMLVVQKGGSGWLSGESSAYKSRERGFKPGFGQKIKKLDRLYNLTPTPYKN